MRHPRLLLLTATTLALVATAGIAVWAAGSRSVDAGASAVSVSVDCDVTTAGVQSDCSYATGTTAVAIDVVVSNNGPAFNLSAFDFLLDASSQSAFNPVVTACAHPYLSCNPDALVTAFDWSCGPPPPNRDENPDPGIASSSLSCFNYVPGEEVPSGGSIAVGRIHYQVTGDVFSSLSFQYYDVFDDLGVWLSDCASPSPCGGATVTVGSPTGTFTHTNTPTQTPTITPTSTPNASPSPGVGAVTDVLGLHETICITAPVAKLGVPGVVMLFNCAGIGNQVALQTIVGCITDHPACPNPPFEGLLQPTPDDFAPIDVDGNQIHAGQALAIIAFVDADYPVLFETNRGRFVGNLGQTAGASALCYTEFDTVRPADPDCDANLSTPGDGVVAARLIIDPIDPRGPGQVTVTQNGVSKTLDFTIAGPPETISITSLDSKTAINTGALPSMFPWEVVPRPGGCDQIVEPPIAGSTHPSKTNLFVQALDSDGVPLVGAVIAVEHVDGTSAAFRNGRPVGGLASPILPTWDFGSEGAGAVGVVCGGIQSGLLDLQLLFDDGSASQISFSPYADFDYRLPYSLPVVAGDQDGDGFLDDRLLAHVGPVNTDTNFDNCLFVANPDQKNSDGNFIGNGPNHVVDDLTAPDSDAEGDACDDDDDNDLLDDDEESAGSHWSCEGKVTDPLNADTDGDGARDGEDCFFGDPLNPAIRPQADICGGRRTDDDGDALSAYLERCAYGTSDSFTFSGEYLDSDDDGVTDGCEVASLNDDTALNSADQLLLAIEYTRVVLTRTSPHPNFDLNKDGRVNSLDQLLMGQIMFSGTPCIEDLPD